MISSYPASFEVVSEKRNLSGFSALNEKERAIYTIWWLEAEVNNGGFHQYFWNSAGDYADIALKSLKNIGSVRTAALLEEAIEIAFDGKFSSDRQERQNRLEIEEDRKMEELDRLDNEFYRYSEDFYKMIDDFS